MDWGSGITYLGETLFKGRETRFGIKDADRFSHVVLSGRAATDRAAFVAQMALQDARRGAGVVVMDGSGDVSETFIERLPADARAKLIYLDPSDAEYPFSWNPLPAYRELPREEALPLLERLITSLYRARQSPLVEWLAEYLYGEKESTLLAPYELTAENASRDKMLTGPDRNEFDALLAKEEETASAIRTNGRYLAKDTLVRNLIGQNASKFTLSVLRNGGVVVVNLSRIRMFPTRLIPLVRLFTHAVWGEARAHSTPCALYLSNVTRALTVEEAEELLDERSLMAVCSDPGFPEEEKDARKRMFLKAGSVVAFAPNQTDLPLIGETFFPYIHPEEADKLEAGEYALTLSIDAVRSHPFFARASSLPQRENVSYQDIQVDSRNAYATPRREVDKIFQKRYAAPVENRPTDPGSFSNAFRSMFARNANQGGQPAPARPASTPLPASSAPKAPVQAAADGNKKPSELSEDELRTMLHVDPIPEPE